MAFKVLFSVIRLSTMGRRVSGIRPSLLAIFTPSPGISQASSSSTPTVSGERLYCTYLNQFTQPDTIIPNPYNPQDYNRYAYARNNPVKYTDPSGHSVDCGLGDSICTTKPSNQLLISDRHTYLVRQVKDQKIKDLEAFAQLTDYAAGLSGNCTKCFINDLGAVLTGHSGGDGRSAAYREILIQANWPGVEYNPYYTSIRGKSELMQSGYADIFKDPAYKTLRVGGNQSHHYWFYVQYGYETGEGPAILANLAHETIASNDPSSKSINDYYLGVEGAKLGNLLSQGAIKPGDVGNYIRQTLSPGSATSQLYQGAFDGVIDSLSNYP